jgi:hypothetical protein
MTIGQTQLSTTDHLSQAFPSKPRGVFSGYCFRFFPGKERLSSIGSTFGFVNVTCNVNQWWVSKVFFNVKFRQNEKIKIKRKYSIKIFSIF